MTEVIAFDVNETLLELSPLDELLGGAQGRMTRLPLLEVADRILERV